jgi:hypothetical protein
VLLSDVLLDDRVVMDGAWLTYQRPGATESLRLRLRRAGQAYQARYTRAIAPILTKIREGTASEHEIQRAVAPAVAELVTGWDLEEVVDGVRAPIPYSVERCAEILARPGACHLSSWIQGQASRDEMLADAARKDAEGN